MLFIVDGGVYALASPLIGLILDRRVDCKLLLLFGCQTISVGFFVLGPALEPSVAQLSTGAAIHGLGMALNFLSSYNLLVKGKAMGEVGLVTSLWIVSENAGGFLGALAGGAAYDV